MNQQCIEKLKEVANKYSFLSDERGFMAGGILELLNQLSALIEAARPMVAYTSIYDDAFSDKMRVLHYSKNGGVVKVTLGDLRSLAEAVKMAKGEKEK